MLGNPPPVSPYVYRAADYQGFVISATFDYDNTTRVLLDATLHRDAACVYTHIVVGTGADGKPNSSTRVLNLTGFSGDKAFTAQQLSGVGLNTIDDVLGLQITAY